MSSTTYSNMEMWILDGWINSLNDCGIATSRFFIFEKTEYFQFKKR